MRVIFGMPVGRIEVVVDLREGIRPVVFGIRIGIPSSLRMNAGPRGWESDTPMPAIAWWVSADGGRRALRSNACGKERRRGKHEDAIRRGITRSSRAASLQFGFARRPARTRQPHTSTDAACSISLRARLQGAPYLLAANSLVRKRWLSTGRFAFQRDR